MTTDASAVAGTAVALRPEPHHDLLDVAVEGDLDDLDALDAVVDAVAALSAGARDRQVRLVADHPADVAHPLPGAVAARLGLTEHRELLQLRRPLPVPEQHPARRGAALPLRRFDPGRDALAWIRQNNRAFAWHPDQGHQDEASLRATLDEPWVELAGFLVLDDPDRPGELAGSCWTRRHEAADGDPALGEIFVIGVDPSCQGRGLGTALVLAGLDHLAAAGLRVGMLYVEATNAAALGTYERLGFVPHLRRRIAAAPHGGAPR